MKRIFSAMLACLLLVGCVFSLASCFSNVSEKYAEKVEKAAEAKEHLTYEEVLEDLGDDAIDITVDLGTFLGGRSGVILAFKGCKTFDDVKEKVEGGKEIEGLMVAIGAGKAEEAEYDSIDAEDLEEIIDLMDLIGFEG